MKTIELNINGVWLEAKFEMNEADGDGWNSPRTEAHFVLCDVLHEGKTIIEILSGDMIERIEEEIEEEIGVAA